MGRIAQFLAEPEHLVSKQIERLEAKNGYPSHDARLIAENVQKIRIKLTELGLDPDDTTAQELYHALQAKFDQDSRLFDEYFGVTGLGFDKRASQAVSILTSSVQLPRQWVIKSGELKKLLKDQPPKRLMKQLHFRSIESLLKREKLDEILTAAKYTESAAWRRAFDKAVSRLDQTNLEMRRIKLGYLEFKKWSDIANPSQTVIYDENTASLNLWPSEGLNKTPLLSMALLMFEGLEQFGYFNASAALSKKASMLNWWSDMDHLVADLGLENVSLNMSDCSANLLANADYESRQLDYGRSGFWKELVSRYENLPELDGFFDHSAKVNVSSLKLKAPDMALEFAEDF